MKAFSASFFKLTIKGKKTDSGIKDSPLTAKWAIIESARTWISYRNVLYRKCTLE